MNKKHKNNPFYYFFRLIIGIFGVLVGIVIGLTFFYPLILAFPNNLISALFEAYLLIFLSIGFYRIFDIAFANYIDYKPILHNNGFKIFFEKKNFAFSFYIFGVILFIYFILGF